MADRRPKAPSWRALAAQRAGCRGAGPDDGSAASGIQLIRDAKMLEDAIPFVIAFIFAFVAGFKTTLRKLFTLGAVIFWGLGSYQVWMSLGISSGAQGGAAGGAVAPLDIGRLMVTAVLVVVLGGVTIVFYRLGSDI